MNIDLNSLSSLSLIITASFSLFYTKIRTGDNTLDLKKLREKEIPQAIAQLKELYEKDHASLKETNTVLKTQLDTIQVTLLAMVQSLGRLEGKRDKNQ